MTTGTKFTIFIEVLFLNSGYLPHTIYELLFKSRVSCPHRGSLPISLLFILYKQYIIL